MAKLIFKANKKQKEAFRLLFDNIHTEIWYGWWAGWWKSYMWVAWCWMMCSKCPWTRYAFWRQELKRLKQTTLESYFKFLSDYKIPEQQKGVYNWQDSVIKFANGSQILLLDLAYLPSDPLYTRLGSLELTGAFVDEAAEVDDKCITILSTRVWRQLNKKYSLAPKILLTFNPDKGHVYRNYYLPYKNGTLPEYRAFVPALATDNEFIPETYIEQLERSDEVTKQRLLYGNFEYDDTPWRLFDYQAINNLWNNAKNDWEVFVSCDVARFWKDKTVIMLWKGWHIEKIIELASSSTVQVCEEIHKLQQLHSFPLSRCVVDEDGVWWGVVDNLGCKGFINNSKAISPANSNKVSYKKRNYKNLKTQCYFLLAEKVNNWAISIDTDYCKDKLVQELDIIVQTHIDDDSTLQIITKDEIKEKIGRSPDYSDAMMMRLVFELTTRWPVWEVIQWKTELIDSFEIDDRWQLPEDMEEEETVFEEVELTPY